MNELDAIDQAEVTEAVTTIRSNTGSGRNHCWWLSRVVPFKEVHGFYVGIERTSKGVKVNTTGGPVNWPMRPAVADAVVHLMQQQAAA